MKIVLSKVLGKELLFEAKSKNNGVVRMEGPISMGGENIAQSPMETLLSAVAGCSVIDVIHILKKQRQDLEDIQVVMTSKRKEIDQVKPFSHIHLHFKLFGDIKTSKADRAVSLSVEKYCSVAASLNEDIEITHDFEIV